MVEVPENDLSEAADTIDKLFEAAFGSRNLSAVEMREALETADALRDAIPEYDVPGVGSEMYDPITESKVQVVTQRLKTAGEAMVSGKSVAEYNEEKHGLSIADDEPVVEVEYGNGSWKRYTMPVTRLEPYEPVCTYSCKYMEGPA